MTKKPPLPECTRMILAIRDAKDVLTGKWKTIIIGALMFKGKLRFMDLMREVDGIAPKMLSKELQELEMQQLVTRTVVNSKPITVEYELTEHGRSLDPLLREIAKWGDLHRTKIMKKKKTATEQ